MAEKSPGPPSLTLSQFLIGAGLFEGALLLVALAVGALLGVNPTAQLEWSWKGFGMGLLATVPMLMFFAYSRWTPNKGFRQIREFLTDVLGPMLDQCRLIDLVGLALLAGVCEEVLFRGLIFQYLNLWNATFAILVTNVLFGIVHSITPLYAWLAGIIGLYLTSLLTMDPSPNLLVPMTAHTVYDFIAFLLVRQDYRKQQSQAMQNDDDDALEE